MGTNLTVLRRSFVDVCKGYSIGQYRGDTVYVRHLGHFEHTSYDLLQASFEAEARANKAPTEEERLTYLRQKGLWSDDKETQITRQRDTIARFEDGRKSIALPSILKSHEASIEREKQVLIDMLTERAKLIGVTAEMYAIQRLEDHYMVHNLFVDREMTKLYYDADTFDGLPDSEVEAVQNAYKTAIEPCSDANLRRLAVQDFFTSYYGLCQDDLQAFFGRPICELTYYQVKLGNVARYYKSLMESTDLSKIPQSARGDPDAIERTHITQKNTAAITSEGKTPVGMTQDDIKQLGMENTFTKLPPTNMSGMELVKWMRSQRPPG